MTTPIMFLLSHARKKVCYPTKVVLAAPGRSGAYWFCDVATKLGIRHNFGPMAMWESGLN